MEHYTELVNRAKQGDVQAFSRLYETCYKEMYRFALYNLGHEEDAKDAVSDTVLAAFENIGKLREAEAFKAWIFRILYNQCVKRRRQYTVKTEEIPESMPAASRDDAEAMDVRRAFESLQPEDRMIVSMTVFAGYSSGEIGKLMNKNPNTVRSRLSRSMGKMQKLLEV